MEGRILLDIAVIQGEAILKLLSVKDQSLIVYRHSNLVVDLGLEGANGVRAFHLKGDGLSIEGGRHKDLHATTWIVVSLLWILALTVSMVSELSFPVRGSS